MDAEVESTGYFVVAEALTNAIKHAAAQQITVDLAAQDGRLEITVTDDGSGPGRRDPGFGLRSLQDRVAALDGTVDAPPAPSRGNDLAGGVRMRLIIAEDDVLLREGIARILGDEGYEVVAQAGDRDDLLGEGPRAPSRMSSSPTSGCRRPSPATGIAAALQIRRELPGHRDHRAVAAHRHPRRAGAADARRRRGSGTS